MSGEVQAITAGSGVSIDSDGVLSANIPDPVYDAFVRTNNVAAYNDYVWPVAQGSNGQYLQIDASGNLSWSTVSAGVTSVNSNSSYITVSPTTGDVRIGFIDNAASFFNPYVSIGGGDYQGRVGEGGLATYTFTAPDGCNRMAIWSRCRFTIQSLNTSTDANCTKWANDVQYFLGGSGINILESPTGVDPRMSVSCRAGRGNGTCFTRFNSASVPGGGNRTVSISVTGRVPEGAGDDQWLVTIDAPQLIILPYQL